MNWWRRKTLYRTFSISFFRKFGIVFRTLINVKSLSKIHHNITTTGRLLQSNDRKWDFLFLRRKEFHHENGNLPIKKFQAEACNFTKINTPPWVFFTFLKLYKWYQIAQRTAIYTSARLFLPYKTRNLKT